MKFKKICILHLNQIGDLVFSMPFLRALKVKYPEAEIHSVIRPYLQELLEDSPFVNRLLFRKSGIKDILALLREIRKNRYDLLVSLSGSEECLFLTTFSRAGLKVGFTHFVWDFSLDIKEKSEGHPGWYNNGKLLKRLNVEIEKRDYTGLISLPVPEKDLRDLIGDDGFNFQEGFVIISAGTSAGRTIKAWEERKFADLIIVLKKKYNLNPVLVGSKDNKETNDKIIEIIKERGGANKVDTVLNLSGKIGLKDLCYILKQASLFVGVDSGIMHLASSFDIPVVGIFGPTDPFHVGPQNKDSIVVQKEEMKCVPCYLKGCQGRDCMKKLEVNEVLAACEKLPIA